MTIKRDINVLVLCDDFWHPAQVPKGGLSPLKDHGFTFDWIEDAHDWSVNLMAKYPLVILTKSNNVSSSDPGGWMTDAVQAAFAEYVRNGNGLLAIHSGTASYQDTLVLRNLLGGVFAHHPDQCAVTLEPQTGHPLTQGVAAFTVKDEHYFMSIQDSQLDVFLTSSSEHGHNVHVQPAGWKREIGKGRVAVLTPGHNLDVWLDPNFQMLLHNILRWCGRV